MREASEVIGEIYSIEGDVEHLDSNNFGFEDSEGEWVARFDTGGMGGPFANIKNSIEQEAEIIRILNEESDFPAPGLRGVHTEVERPFIAVEHFESESWIDYAEKADRESMLDLFEMTGEAIAEAHRIGFDKFGEIQSREEVNPGFTTAYDWLEHAIETQTNFATESSAIQPQELKQVESYTGRFMDEFESELREYDSPVLVISDIHPGNIGVSEGGESICFYDLEFGRAGMPVEDIYRTNSELAGTHEEVGREEAYDRLVRGYEGIADYDQLNRSLADSGIPFAINLMSLIEYYEQKDEDRTERQGELKECLLDTVTNEAPDYDQYRKIWNS